MEVRMKYDNYWREKKLERFLNYERDMALLKIFPRLKEGHRIKVLDVGGGDGAVSFYLNAGGYDIVLVDISVEACRKAKIRGLQAIVADAQSLPIREKFFDVVWGGDLVEHLFNPLNFVKEAFRVTRVDGELIFSCPNMAYWGYRLHYLLTGYIPKTEGSLNDPWDWEHIRFFNVKTLKRMLEKGGLVMIEVQGVARGTFQCKLATKHPSIFATVIVARARKRELSSVSANNL